MGEEDMVSEEIEVNNSHVTQVQGSSNVETQEVDQSHKQTCLNLYY